MELRIDPEFASRIPPLTDDEFKQLEENILADGVVINPIIVWDGVIIDGHNRFQVIQNHPHIQFTTYEKGFRDKLEAIAWICKNQLGRRNLTPEQKKYLSYTILNGAERLLTQCGLFPDQPQKNSFLRCEGSRKEYYWQEGDRCLGICEDLLLERRWIDYSFFVPLSENKESTNHRSCFQYIGGFMQQRPACFQ